MTRPAPYNLYQGPVARARDLYFRKVVRRFVTPTGLVVDVGCGQGDFLDACRRLDRRAVGIDPDERWRRHCVARGLDVRDGSALALPFGDTSAETVFAQSVLEHLADPLAAGREMRRVLAPGGHLILSCPTPGTAFWDDPTHVRPHTPRSLHTLCAILDVEVVYLSYVLGFLVGVEVSWPVVYRVLNRVPLVLGTNLLVVARKPS